jgi:hypothetical protein
MKWEEEVIPEGRLWEARKERELGLGQWVGEGSGKSL